MSRRESGRLCVSATPVPGVENAPAPASGRGLECDKLSKEGHRGQLRWHDGQAGGGYRDRNGRSATSGLVATHIDSWENGSQNWTAKMREEFQHRRGYDLLPFLPVMTGRVVDTLEIFGTVPVGPAADDIGNGYRELCRSHARVGRCARYAVYRRGLRQPLRLRCRTRGSPTSRWASSGRPAVRSKPVRRWPPPPTSTARRSSAPKPLPRVTRRNGASIQRVLKALGDRVFCEGVNRFVFHRYALQPWDDQRVPGMTMGPWGQHYERTQTWWEWTPAWHTYLARCQYLLRQGLFVADVCYVLPEAPPQGPRDYPRQGYTWDECPAEVVLTRMSVENDRIVLPDGMSYRLLVLPDLQTMTPQLLRKVKELVAAGATVLGPRPVMSPSLSNHPDCDVEIRDLSDELWGDCDGQRVKQHAFGRGRVVWGLAPEKVLQESGLPADFSSDQPLHYIHRQLDDTDIYFVASPHPYARHRNLQFSCHGQDPGILVA